MCLLPSKPRYNFNLCNSHGSSSCVNSRVFLDFLNPFSFLTSIWSIFLSFLRPCPFERDMGVHTHTQLRMQTLCLNRYHLTPEGSQSFSIIRNQCMSWPDGSAVKTAYWCFRGPNFGTQQPYHPAHNHL